MHKDLISIIVLTYNHADFIARNLQGVFEQRVDADIELIIADDASKDATVEIIQTMVSEVPANFKVKLFTHQKNLGATPNFYFALEQATGTYLAFCEGDDYWTDPEKLQLQLDFMERNTGYNMCFHQVINISEDVQYKDQLFSIIENRDYTMLEIYQHWMVHTTSVFMRSAVLENSAAQELRRHPELLYFDTFLYMCCGMSGKIRGFSNTMSAYVRHEIGISNGVNHQRDLRHNLLDEIIGNTFGGKITESSNWQIFSRSRIAFVRSLRQGHLTLAWKHFRWILKRKGNLKVYLISTYLR